MKLKVLDIPEGGLDLKATAEDRWFTDLLKETFSEDYRAGDPASLKLYLLRTCDNIVLTGTAEIPLRPSCDRCLEGFERPLVVTLHVNLAPSRTTEIPEGEEVEIEEKDLNFAFYQGDEINLAEILREMLVLEIPLRNLCSESCKGLCPQCGQNLNKGRCACTPPKGDPRFAALKKFLT